MDLSLFEVHAVALLLHMARSGGFMAVVPVFGRQRDTMHLRVILATTLGAMFWWIGGMPIEMPVGVIDFALLVIREAFVGLVLGFALSMMTSLLFAAGEIISIEMGFSMARAMNPESGVQATVISQLFQVFGFLLILHLEIHHEALRVLAHTYEACPVGEPFALEPIWEGIRALVAGSIIFAVQYAFPILGIMLLLTVGLVLLSRAVPHINLMEFSFTARVLVGLIAASFFLTNGTPFLARTFEAILGAAVDMFPG